VNYTTTPVTTLDESRKQILDVLRVTAAVTWLDATTWVDPRRQREAYRPPTTVVVHRIGTTLRVRQGVGFAQAVD
jgi:hypothetical protein